MDGFLDAARNGAQGGLVEDEFAAGGDSGEEGFVEDGAVEEFEGEAGEVVGAAAGEVVEDDDVGAEGAEGFGEMGADEAGAAGDEDAGAAEGGAVKRWPVGLDGGLLLGIAFRRISDCRAGEFRVLQTRLKAVLRTYGFQTSS